MNEDNDSIQRLQTNNRRYFLIGIAMAVGIAAMTILMVSMGAMNLGLWKTHQILWAELTQNTAAIRTFQANEVAVVWDIRLPRILCSIFVGMGLAVAGTIFQSLLRNPLADPYTLGVSTGAAFGASLAILANITAGLMISTVTSAFVFAFLTLLVVILIAQKGDGMLSSNLIISGIIVNAVLSSGISLIKMLAGENVSAIVFWLMGSLSSKQWSDVWIIAPIVSVASIISFIFADSLNIMIMGEESAKALGVNTKRIRLLYLVLGSCITAACVAVSGVIGFIGLIVPHILRFWLTSNNRILIPISALFGGLLLCVADSSTRLMTTGEIPVGVITTLIGGPFFIYVFLRRQKN